MKKIFFVILLVLSFPLSSMAWTGYDTSSGEEIEIESGNLVRSGEEIEIYDYDDGEYKSVEVLDVYSSFGEVVVEVDEEGETRTFEME